MADLPVCTTETKTTLYSSLPPIKKLKKILSPGRKLSPAFIVPFQKTHTVSQRAESLQ